MWLVSGLVFLANPLIGAVLLMSAAITTNIRATKVDAEYAKRGELPPTARLVDAWLNRQKAAGKAPESAKVRPYGSLAYARQRWLAMWEDLGEKHREQRAAHKKQLAEAKKNGTPPPSKPSLTEQLGGWKWSIPGLTRRDEPGSPPPSAASADPEPAVADGPVSTCDECGVQLPDGGWKHPPGSTCPKAAKPSGSSDSNTAAPAAPEDPLLRFLSDAQEAARRNPMPFDRCPRCGTTATITPSGWCEKCTMQVPHGMCEHCQGVVRLDGTVWRHGAHWPCRHTRPAAGDTIACTNCRTRIPVHPAIADMGASVRCQHCGAQVAARPPRPASALQRCPRCSKCDGPTVPSMNQLRGGFCPRCDTTDLPAGSERHGKCDRCGLPGRLVVARKRSTELLHDANGSTICPYETPQLRELRRTDPGTARIYDEIVAKHLRNTPAVDTQQTAKTPVPAREEGASMPEHSGEVTGIPSAVHYLQQMAAAHRQHADNEAMIATLAGFHVGATDLALVQQAIAASNNAADLYADAATTIDDGNAAVRQGYASAPDAADKHAQMAE